MRHNTPYRVAPRKLLSLRKHALACLATLICVPAAAVAATHFIGDSRDSLAGGSVAVAEIAPPTPAYDLNAGAPDSGQDLPNLMAGNASTTTAPKPNDNLPDALGNLGNGNDMRPSDDTLAGDVQLSPSQSPSRPSGSVPSQATIGGQPIDSIGNRDSQTETSPGRFVPAGGNSSGPLPAAPMPGLTRMTPFGPVPTRGPSGAKALTSYAKPFTPPADAKTVSVIVGGLGINRAQTQRAIDELPPEVTLSFASQSANLQRWINAARAKGHEVVLELPMEPYNFDTSTPTAKYTLRAQTRPVDNIRNLDYLLSRGQGYFAVTNYLGEKFFDTEAAVGPVVKHLNTAGLGFIYDGIGDSPALTRAAALSRLPVTQNQSVIDVTPNAQSVERALRALEQNASSKSPALGIGFSYAGTIDGVIAWAEDASKRGITLAPASYVLSQSKP